MRQTRSLQERVAAAIAEAVDSMPSGTAEEARVIHETAAGAALAVSGRQLRDTAEVVESGCVSKRHRGSVRGEGGAPSRFCPTCSSLARNLRFAASIPLPEDESNR